MKKCCKECFTPLGCMNPYRKNYQEGITFGCSCHNPDNQIKKPEQETEFKERKMIESLVEVTLKPGEGEKLLIHHGEGYIPATSVVLVHDDINEQDLPIYIRAIGNDMHQSFSWFTNTRSVFLTYIDTMNTKPITLKFKVRVFPDSEKLY